MTRFGVCTSPEHASAASEAGFDFIECAVGNSLNAQGGSRRFKKSEELVTSSGLASEAFNCFLPPDLKVTGPEVNMQALEQYVAIAFNRARALGGEIVVFGSGGARSVPEGFPVESAREQLVRFLEMAAPPAEANGITIAIEPLASRECNIINSVAEAAELAGQVDHAAVKVLADIYHMAADNEPFEAIEAAGELLVHVHVSDPETRKAPLAGNENVLAFFRTLHAAKYSGRLSLECAWGDFESEAAMSLEALKGVWHAAASW